MPFILDEPSDTGQGPPGYQLLQHGHKDIVGATAYNASGNRLACSSADGRIKIYNRHTDNTWHLCDAWKAHKAEILEIKWLPPTIHPHLLSTISLDGWFRIWAEIPNIPPLSGRRFKNLSNNTIHQHRSPARTPWHSFDIKHDPVSRHTYLALLASNGLLFVYENDQPENMSHWEKLDQFEVVSTASKRQNGQKGRGANSSNGAKGEIGFKVRFDPNPEPCWRAINAGMARDGLSLIVADMENARIWRTKEVKHSTSLGKTSERVFYMAEKLTADTGFGVIRDVAWAGGSLRGHDIVGAVWSDGTVRIFKIFNPPLETIERPSTDHSRIPGSRTSLLVANAANRPSTSPARQPSGIGSQLAGERAMNGHSGRQQEILASQAGQIPHVITQVGKLDAHGGGAQRLMFDEDGEVLMTAGDDGCVKVWRMRPNGEWSNSATLSLTGTPIN